MQTITVEPGSISADDLRNQTDVLDICESNRDDIRFFTAASLAPFKLRNWAFKFSELNLEAKLFLQAAYRL